MIVIHGQIKTSQIMQCSINSCGDKFNIVFNNAPSKTYSYSRSRVKWLTDPVLFNPQHCHIYLSKSQLYSLSYIAFFKQYWYVEYQNGAHASYQASEIQVVKSCLNNKQSKSTIGSEEQKRVEEKLLENKTSYIYSK